MHDYAANTYGERIADIYDSWYAAHDERCIDVLAELARGGPALELGIGTGRIALPLRERGVSVHGIDASPAMVAKLRAKPGGAEVPVTMATFSDFAVDGRFAGLRLEHRWADWARAPFGSESTRHVSVYRRVS